MSDQVLIERRALKEFNNLPSNMVDRVQAAIDELRSQLRPHNAKKLAGSRDQWRVRAGDYRVLYEINDHSREVRVYAIGHRREVYR